MSLGLIGKKCGMTRVFTEDGSSIPVSVIAISDNYVTQMKSETGLDGYNAIQLGTDFKKAAKVNKASKGHFAKADVQPVRVLQEFRVSAEVLANYKLGDLVKLDSIFTAGNYVDVVGKSRGKGFAGVIKRHNFSSQRMSHGNSLAHRAPGSIGQCQDPGRVFKGKKMAGHMGNAKTTVQSLEIVRVDSERNVILVKGAIPGAPGCDVVVNVSVKKSDSKAA